MGLFLSFVMTLTLGWSGLGISNVYANNTVQSVQAQQQTIEHMKTVRLTSYSFDLEETWYNGNTGYTRVDDFHYYNPGSAVTGKFEPKENIKTEKTINQAKEKLYNSLFEYVIQSYQNEIWKPIETVELSGKQVKKLKYSSGMPGVPVYSIAYIDLSTGLPIKEEDYDKEDKVMQTRLYFFDHVNDPTGEIFKQTIEK
ncbi:hypothetical protein GAY21_23295 [Phocaeicola vulgatus]|nr:hypothetical protein GAY21_23295 [Phocaeicola vulgatus]